MIITVFYDESLDFTNYDESPLYFNWLIKQNSDICLPHETYSTENVENQFEKANVTWTRDIYFAFGCTWPNAVGAPLL